MASSRSRHRPTGFGLLMLTGVCVVLPATAMLVTAVDVQARGASAFGGATPVALGIAIAVVLASAIALGAGRGGTLVSIGLLAAAAVFAVVGLGLLTHGTSVMTAGVILLPAAVTTLVLARIAWRSNAERKAMR